MTHLIETDDLSTAWAEAVSFLNGQPQYESWDLVVSIANPLLGRLAVRSALDECLSTTNRQSVATVANTVFPDHLWHTCVDRDSLYRRYIAMLPKLHRFSGNQRGLYFERLISWPPKSGAPVNQLEAMIQRLDKQLKVANTKRFVYDLTVLSPEHDSFPIGFPCLAYVNVKLRHGKLCLLAHYRNHYFIARAYGNYLGLSHLQEYIASAVGIGCGPLVCVSAHATLDGPRGPILRLVSDPSFTVG